MSEREQARAVALLQAALRVLTDQWSTAEERGRVADDIALFINHDQAEPQSHGERRAG